MKLNIFFSWQTQTNDQGFNNKKFLIECINTACKEIQNKGELKVSGSAFIHCRLLIYSYLCTIILKSNKL